MLTNHDIRTLLLRMFEAAVAAADPAKVLARHLPEKPRGRCIVVGAGKAAGSMAAAVEAAWPDVDLSGVVVAPYGHAAITHRIQVREAAHPTPDSNSVAAAREILAAVRGLSSDDLVLALISGGGSSTMCLPAPGLTLEDKQAVNKALLASGLDIRTMNAVRRRVSAIKGGKLALTAAPAKVVTLAISDIPGDDATAIASGPTVPDPTASLDLSEVAARLAAKLPKRVTELLTAPSDKAGELSTANIELIATPALALQAAADIARAAGISPVILGDDIEGESSSVGISMAALAQRAFDQPTVLVSGGETTVTLDGARAGRGGRNTEFLLSLVCALNASPNVWALAADTDGEDGVNLGAAGAIAGPDTIARAHAAGIDPAAYLAAHDSGSFFQALGDLITTGPTRTNVNDFRAIVVLPR
jgi:glycerate 2-kinase